MGWSINLFRVSGIPIRVHVTFVLILIWAAFAWASAPGATAVDAVVGVVAMFLLFGCILLHELAHSLVALHFGSRVRDIVLLPIGGVSQIEDMPGRPGQELQVALVGPLVSLILGGAWLVVAELIAPQTVSPAAALTIPVGSNRWLSLPIYLALANLVLAIFNLLPAFPMDGGRALRALLAMWFGHRKATTIAVWLGEAMAFIFALIGLWSGNVVLIVVAIFVWLAAGSEGAVDTLRGSLGQVLVAQAMIRQPLVLSMSDGLGEAVRLTLTSSQADFPVVETFEPTRLAGFLTRSDLIKGLHDHAGASVGDVMRREFLTAAPRDTLFATQQRMRAAGLTAIPVIESGLLVGLLTVVDINEAYELLWTEPTVRPQAS